MPSRLVERRAKDWSERKRERRGGARAVAVNILPSESDDPIRAAYIDGIRAGRLGGKLPVITARTQTIDQAIGIAKERQGR